MALPDEAGMTKLTNPQRRELIHVYLTQGLSAAKPLCAELGIDHRKISQYTRAMGIKGKRGRPTGKRVVRPKYVKWGWAVSRGSVVA